jgi:hypothetical protein
MFLSIFRAQIIISHNSAFILIHQGVTYTIVNQVHIWEGIRTDPRCNYSEVHFFVFEHHAACSYSKTLASVGVLSNKKTYLSCMTVLVALSTLEKCHQ